LVRKLMSDVVWRVAGIVCVVWGVASSNAAAQSTARMDLAIAEAQKSNRPVPALVRVAPDAVASVAALLNAKGTPVEVRLPGALALRVTLHPKDFADVLALPGVLGLSADAVVVASASKKTTSSVTTSKTTTDTATTSEASAPTSWWSSLADWSTAGAQSSALFGSLGTQWVAERGAGVRVAVVDSGIDGTAPEFAERIVDFYDFTNGGRRATPSDEYGHGTHVAGLIGAASSTFRGVAPKVEFVGVKVLDASGQGRTSDVLAALEFLTENRRRLSIHVVNLSMGHPILEPAATDPLVQAVERAVAAGLVVVVSAGNIGQNPVTGVGGYAGITSPGNAPSALTAGSLDLHGTADRRDDTVSPFSSRGPTWYDGLVKPDLVAPGHGLFAVSAEGSTLAGSTALSSTGDAAKMYGTSMAAATTTGVVALMLEANRATFPDARRDLAPNALKAILQFTSIAVHDRATGSEYDQLTEGAGAINALGAITLARHLDPAALVGTWWLRTSVDEHTTLAGISLPWTRRIIWGDTVLHGQTVYVNAPAWQSEIVWGDTLVWGETLIWGETFVGGDTLVWGENVVEATALIWGESIVWGDGLVSIDGQSFVWGDTFVWGESFVWGDAVIRGQ
jgi:serine protease AprX